MDGMERRRLALTRQRNERTDGRLPFMSKLLLSSSKSSKYTLLVKMYIVNFKKKCIGTTSVRNGNSKRLERNISLLLNAGPKLRLLKLEPVSQKRRHKSFDN